MLTALILDSSTGAMQKPSASSAGDQRRKLAMGREPGGSGERDVVGAITARAGSPAAPNEAERR
jgi:hypothetical protein